MSDLAASAPVAAQLEQDTERDQSPSMNNAVTATEDVEMKDAPAGDSAPTTEEPVAPNSHSYESKDASLPTNSETNGNGVLATPQSSSKQQKRKSIGGTPSNKKLLRKKSMPDMHLDVRPGQHWFVRMKGFTAWPAIICDEEMLPLSLLEKRPVSAMRPDGTWREDFREGGKNVRERRYPVLFLGTYEFGWQVNTELMPLDLDEVKSQVARGDQGKKSKALWSAYQVAAEGQTLEWFKELLEDHESSRKAAEEAAIAAEEERIAAEEEKKAKKEAAKEAKKKAKAAGENGDVEMEDADAGSEKKKSKKRKKEDGETDTPKPKTKIVLKGLKSTGEDGGEPKPKKAKKAKATEGSDEDKKAAEPQLSPEELRKRREKHVLFLRHKLQKGLVSKDNPVKSEEMQSMNEHLTALETFQDLEPQIIRETKVAKLLKVILKLDTIPRDEEFKFKERCTKLLAAWTAILSSDDVKRDEPTMNGETKTEKSAEPVTNGSGPAEKEEKEASAAAENMEPKAEPVSVDAAA